MAAAENDAASADGPMVKRAILLILAAASLAACERGMDREARVTALEHSEAFADGRASRPPVPGTVPTEATDRPNGEAEALPLAQGGAASNNGIRTPAADRSAPQQDSRRVIARGGERYAIYCAPCHGPRGRGDGPLIRHGYPPVPSLAHGAEARYERDYVYDVISNGTGAMPGFRDRISPDDRWAIIHFLEALQQETAGE